MNIIYLILFLLIIVIILLIINCIKNKDKFNNLEKLDAFCINLKHKPENFNFINNEWSNYLNINRFIALDNCTKSHKFLLNYIWTNKETLKFPIVIMEDDVYKLNNFDKYWNLILDVKNVDYITLDCMLIQISKNQNLNNNNFVLLDKHNQAGFIIYFKQFFDKFKSINDLNSIIKEPIDMSLTHNKNIIKATPIEQICIQKYNKISSTSNNNTNYYGKHYKETKKILEKYKKSLKIN